MSENTENYKKGIGSSIKNRSAQLSKYREQF